MLTLTSRGGAGGGVEGLQKKLGEMRARGVQMPVALNALGRWFALNRIPQSISRNEGNWPAPRRGGRPLMDTGRLRSSFAWTVAGSRLRVGTSLPYARALNRGGTIRPIHGKWLLIPQSPPLTRSQVRAWPHGKAAIRAAYPGSFFREKMPEGPGVYRRRSAGGVERIAAAVREVKLRPYKFLILRPAWCREGAKKLMRWYQSGALSQVAA